MTRRQLAAILVALVMGLVAPAPSSAQVPCDALLVDEAGVLGANALQVREAAGRLVATGADTRVILITTSGGDLDLYMGRVQNRCPSWQDDAGDLKTDLFVVAVSVDEQLTGIYYGSQWDDHLDSQLFRVQQEHMNPRFIAGDVAEGMVAGLDEFNSVLSAPPEPAGGRSLFGPPSPEPRTGVNLWYAAAAVVGAAIATYLAGAGSVHLLRRRREHA